MTSDLGLKTRDPNNIWTDSHFIHSLIHFTITKTNLILSNQTPTSDLVDDLVYVEIISRWSRPSIPNEFTSIAHLSHKFAGYEPKYYELLLSPLSISFSLRLITSTRTNSVIELDHDGGRRSDRAQLHAVERSTQIWYILWRRSTMTLLKPWHAVVMRWHRPNEIVYLADLIVVTGV